MVKAKKMISFNVQADGSSRPDCIAMCHRQNQSTAFPLIRGQRSSITPEKFACMHTDTAIAEESDKKNRRRKKKPGAVARFRACTDVKGLRFGGQFVVRSFTVRRASPLELLRLLGIHPSYAAECQRLPFPSTAAYVPTGFTVLAQQAWRTLALGVGTNRSKAVLFVFESETMRSAVEMVWLAVVPLGDVNVALIRGLTGSEMARFKFRKGCLTIYVYAVRRLGAAGFMCADDLRRILQAVMELKDFVDHTAMLALPSNRSITFQSLFATAN